MIYATSEFGVVPGSGGNANESNPVAVVSHSCFGLSDSCEASVL